MNEGGKNKSHYSNKMLCNGYEKKIKNLQEQWKDALERLITRTGIPIERGKIYNRKREESGKNKVEKGGEGGRVTVVAVWWPKPGSSSPICPPSFPSSLFLSSSFNLSPSHPFTVFLLLISFVLLHCTSQKYSQNHVLYATLADNNWKGYHYMSMDVCSQIVV